MTKSNSCQYIEGEKLDDENKCGKDCEGRSLYCESHHAATHRPKAAPWENDAKEYKENLSL